MNRSPTLHCRFLLIENVLAWRVKNRDAHASIRIDIWVPHVLLEFHSRGLIGEIFREKKSRCEVTGFVKSALRALNTALGNYSPEILSANAGGLHCPVPR